MALKCFEMGFAVGRATITFSGLSVTSISCCNLRNTHYGYGVGCVLTRWLLPAAPQPLWHRDACSNTLSLSFSSLLSWGHLSLFTMDKHHFSCCSAPGVYQRPPASFSGLLPGPAVASWRKHDRRRLDLFGFLAVATEAKGRLRQSWQMFPRACS